MDDIQDAAPSSTEPTTTILTLDPTAAPLDLTTGPAETVTAGGDGEPLIVSPVPNASAPAEASATEAATGDTPIVSGESMGNSISADVPDVSDSASLANAASTESTASEAASEDPNVVASPAASLAESALGSSVTLASPNDATPVVSTSAGSGIRNYIANIKAHLIGFEQASVAKIHAELEAIERML